MQMFRKNSSMHIPNVNIVRRKNACIYLKKKHFKKRMSEKFYVKCVSCQKIFKSFTDKTTNENLIDINLCSVHAVVTSGGGLTSLRSFCSSMYHHQFILHLIQII